MKTCGTFLLIAALGAGVLAQEKPVPKDSIRISIPGCARGQMFTVTRSPEHESREIVEPGRRFRMAGPKALMKAIKGREGSMIEITGLVRKGQLDQRGMAIGSGVRVSPGPPTAGGNIAKNPHYTQVVIDVEGWRPLAGDCSR